MSLDRESRPYIVEVLIKLTSGSLFQNPVAARPTSHGFELGPPPGHESTLAEASECHPRNAASEALKKRLLSQVIFNELFGRIALC